MEASITGYNSEENSYPENWTNHLNYNKDIHLLVRIEWLDSGLSYTDGWKPKDEIVNMTKLAIVETVGILFYETDDTLYVALSVHENDAYGVQLIAKKNIVNREQLMRAR